MLQARAVCAVSVVLLLANTACAREPKRPPNGAGDETPPPFLTTASMTQSSGPSDPPTRVVFRHSPFGLHAAGSGSAYARELNARFIRKIVLWHQAEPEPGRYKIPGADPLVAGIHAAGLDLVVTLRPVSRWGVDVDYAALKREKPHHPWTRFSGPPRNMRAWLEFVRRLVERYDGDGENDMPRLKRPVRYWQIGNEVRWQWQGTLEQYLDLLAQTSRTIRQSDPNAKIILGALTDGLTLAKAEMSRGRGGARGSGRAASGYRKAVQAIDQVLGKGAAHFDILDFHAYDDEPQGLALQVGWLREKMKRLGYTKSIWSLENAGPFDHFTPSRFSEHVVKRHVIALANGVEGFFWSSLNPTLGWSENYLRLALLDRSGRKTPAYHTYRIMAHKLGSVQSIETLKTSPGISAFKAHLPNRSIYIVWCDHGEQAWSLSLKAAVVRVTHIITEPGITQPRIDQVRPANGLLTIRVSSPVFVEAATP